MNTSDDESKGTNGAAPPASTSDAAVAGKAEGEAPAAPETLESRVERIEREKAEAHERMLRVAADFENYKRRVRRDTDEATGRVKEQILKEILPVLDNFERALVAVGKGGSVESLTQGVKLVEKQLNGALEKFGVKGFDAQGESFDPNRHEAIQHVETTDVAPGAVAQVFARGYMLGERLLRAAMVAVAKAPASGASDGNSRNGAASSSHAGGSGDGKPE